MGPFCHGAGDSVRISIKSPSGRDPSTTPRRPSSVYTFDPPGRQIADTTGMSVSARLLTALVEACIDVRLHAETYELHVEMINLLLTLVSTKPRLRVMMMMMMMM